MTLSIINRYNLITCLLALLLWTPAVSAWSQDSDDDILEFAMITDTHQFGSTADLRYAHKNVLEFVKYCQRNPQLDFAIHGGDFYNSYNTDHTQAMVYLDSASQCFSGLNIPFYATRGNHDCNGKCRRPDGSHDNSQIVTDREFFDLFSPISTTSRFHAPEGIMIDADNPTGNYYYRDFPRQRVRMIMLNCYDRDSLEIAGYHGRQLKWLCEEALDFSMKDDPSAWCFLLIGHAFTIDHNMPITRLMHAYVRGQDVYDADEGITYGCRFSQRKRAQCVGLIYGHFHEDIYCNWDGYNMISLMRGYSTGTEPGLSDKCFDHFKLNTRTHTLTEVRVGRGQSRTYSYDVPQQITPGLAFSKADGMGHYAVGGKFGRIVHVTNLDDSGEGSLRWAVNQSGARTIVFDLQGEIHLLSPLEIRHDSITIAGQSSPGAGIRLTGEPLIVNAGEVVLRYLDVEQLTDGDFMHSGLMIDHITAHNTDKTPLAIRRTQKVSVQYCHISTQSDSLPALVAGGFKATYHNNHIADSPCAVQFADREGENRWIQFGRNLITNWKHHALYGGDHQGEISIHENYLIPGPSTLNHKMLDVAEDGTGRYYTTQNVVKGYEQYTYQNKHKLVNDRPGLAYNPLPQDTMMRPFIHPVARPHAIQPAPSCLVRAAFNFVYLFGDITPDKLQRTLLREAGSQYRPEPVCPDSLHSGDVIGYLDRITIPERSIAILYDNDVHCQIDGYPYLEGLRDPTAADTAYVGIVSCGDFLQGGQAGSITHGQAIVDIMRHIKYDALALGSHEFDFELSRTKEMLQELGYPALCANLRHTEADTLVFPAYTIHQYGRRKVAYVGVSSPSFEITNRPTFADQTGHMHYDFDTPHLYHRVQEAVDAARAEGADYVVVLSQLGETPGRFGTSAYAMIQATTGIDVVLDGHTHSVIPQQVIYNHDGDPVIYSQGGKRFANIGKLVIDPDGRISTELMPTQLLGYRDPEVMHVVDSIQALYSASADAYVGYSTANMVKPKEFNRSDSIAINAGNLLCDAMRWIADADGAWINVGSIRNSLPAGEFTRGDIRDMIPYENNVFIVEMNGRQLMRVIQTMLKHLPAEGGFITPSNGLNITFRREGRKFKIEQAQVYDRVRSHFMDIEPNRMYKFATTDYCLSIGWRQKFLKRKMKISDTGFLYSEALLLYINEQLNGRVEPSNYLRRDRISQLP